MQPTSDVPFVLRDRTLLPRQNGPTPEQSYDAQRQLWVSNSTGAPLVTEYAERQGARQTHSEFGESMITETGEGVDQPEGRFASDFGETMNTATAEGHDQSERLSASEFGETMFTKTSEGADQSEGGR